MKQSESINKLCAGLAHAQSQFVTLPKDKAGYGYRYTDLDTVISNIRPILSQHGLGFIQSLTTMDTGNYGLTTRIFADNGEFIEDSFPLPEVTVTGRDGKSKMNKAQELGTAITYMKRYALCAMLGISSDEDTDSVTTPPQEQPRAQQKPATRPQPQKAPQLPGGPDTPEQKKNINYLLGTKKKNGEPVFSSDEVNYISQLRQTKTADEVIDYLRSELKTRTAVQATPSYEEASSGFVDTINQQQPTFPGDDDAIF